jgi:hypothetical protein
MPNHPIQLAHGTVHMGDHITVELLVPNGWLNNHIDPDAVTDEPARVRVTWPPRSTIVTTAGYPAVAAAIARLISESAIALARWKAHGR